MVFDAAYPCKLYLVMDEGRIVQCGIHQELIKCEGRYQTFIKTRERAEGWKISGNETL